MSDKNFKNLKYLYSVLILVILLVILGKMFLKNNIVTSQIGSMDLNSLDMARQKLSERNYGLTGTTVDLSEFRFGNSNPFR